MKLEQAPTPSPDRISELLSRAPSMRVLVLGDFFLDKYLVTDPALSEISVETGLEARQVVEVRCSPGAAGTVTNNLSALGIGNIVALGVIGDDGEGFELLKGLGRTHVHTGCLVQSADRFTPTYMKPMVRSATGERELERLDIKNRSPLASEMELQVLEALDVSVRSSTRAVIVLDQVQERNHGVLTDFVRNALPNFAAAHPEILFFDDSRERIGEFKGVTVKPNIYEAARALDRAYQGDFSLEESGQIGAELAQRTEKPVFLTLGEQGMLVCDSDTTCHVVTIPANGPIDIVGAGDSAIAGIVTA